jgi:hypothetical protein
MRVDFSPFLEAGRANAAANASFGQALGQVAKGFIEGQQKKKRASEIAGFLMGQGVGEKDAMAIAKNPFLQNEYQRKQEAEAKMKMEQSRLATQSNIAAQGRAARQAEIDQKNERADAETQRLIGFSEDLISETIDPAVQQNADMARPGLFALGGDPEMRNRFLDAEMERQPKVTVGSLGSEDFATFARETEMDPRLSANRFMSLQKIEEAEELANQPKAMTPKEELDYTVKLNQELRDQAAEKRKTSEFEEENKPMPPEDSKYAEATLTAIDDALGFLTDDTKKFFSTGMIGQALSNIAGTDATSLRAKLDTITSGVGFGRLSDMRKASKTGGALGSVSEIELRQLNASMGSLDPNQKPSELKKTLETIKKQYESTVRVLKAEKYAYDNGLTFKTPKEAMDFVNQFHGSSPQQTANTIDPADLQSEIDRKKQMLRDRDLQNKYFDNPNIQNLGNVNQGN